MPQGCTQGTRPGLKLGDDLVGDFVVEARAVGLRPERCESCLDIAGFSATGAASLSRGPQPVTANRVRTLTLMLVTWRAHGALHGSREPTASSRQGWKPERLEDPRSRGFSAADSPGAPQGDAQRSSVPTISLATRWGASVDVRTQVITRSGDI